MIDELVAGGEPKTHPPQHDFHLLDHVPLGIVVVRQDMVVLFWNRCLEEWTRVSSESIVGRSIVDRFPHLGHDRYALRFTQVFETGVPTVFSSRLHGQIVPATTSGARERIQHTTVTRVANLHEGQRCAMLSIQDVTDLTHRVRESRVMLLELSQKQEALTSALSELEQSEVELERSNKALHDFTHAAAHDLKAPVRHIRAWASMILEDDGDDLSDSATGKLKDIDKFAARMHNLISSLVSYAQVDASPPVMSVVALNEVFDDARSEFEDVIAETGASVVLGDAPEVRGNPVLLHQLFQNLIGNALKYRKPDVPPKVELRCEQDEQQGWCSISVVDNGIGFDSSRADRIFEPFHRLVTAREIEGSGIGMAMAKKIVELHGGAIAASSKEGHGATFTVTLPLAVKHIRLLIVDDDVADLQLTAHELASSGLVISTAGSSKEAFEIVETGTVDVVLSDYEMPVEDGLRLLKRIAQKYPDVQRLLTSSVSPPGLAESTESGVVQGFWPKTMTAEQLQEFLATTTAA